MDIKVKTTLIMKKIKNHLNMKNKINSLQRVLMMKFKTISLQKSWIFNLRVKANKKT